MTEKTQMDSFSAAQPFAQQPNLFSTGETSWFPKPMMTNPALAAPTTLPSLPVPKPKWYKTRWIYIVIAIVIVLLFIGYAMRSRFMGGRKLGGSPYSAAIKSIANADRQADLQEWSKLWDVSKRPAVKRVLAEVLNSELSPATTQQHSPLPPPAVSTNSNETAQQPAAPPAVDPAFTVA